MEIIELSMKYGEKTEFIVLTEEYLTKYKDYYGKVLRECGKKIDDYGNKYFTYYDIEGDYYIAVKIN